MVNLSEITISTIHDTMHIFFQILLEVSEWLETFLRLQSVGALLCSEMSHVM